MNGVASMTIAQMVAMLSFVGTRAGALWAITVPSLITPKRGAYPWNPSATKVAEAGLVKVAGIRAVFGPDFVEMVRNAQLTSGEGLEKDGSASYKGGPATNKTKWVRNANKERLAFKANASETELYVGLVPTGSLGYEYFTTAGLPVAREIVTPFLRDTSREGQKQGLTKAIRFRDYRLDHVQRVEIGHAIVESKLTAIADALLNGDNATAERLIAEANREGCGYGG